VCSRTSSADLTLFWSLSCFFGHGFLLEFFFLLGGSYIVSPDLELFGVEFFVSLGLRGLLESKSHGLHFLGLGLFFFESQLSSGNSVFIV